MIFDTIIKKTPPLSSLLLLSLYANPAFALNLIESYQLALSSDPTLQAAKYTYQAEKEAVPQALAKFLPQLYAQGSSSEVNNGITPEYNTQSYNLNLNQAVFHYEYFSGLTKAKQVKQRALKTLIAAHQDLMIQSAERYFNILAANDDLIYASSQVKAFAREFDQAKHRFEVGLIAMTDVHQAKAKYDNAIALEIAAKNNVQDQYEQLRILTGTPISSVAGITTKHKLPLIAPNPQDPEAWVHTAHQNNIEIQIAKAAAQIAKTEISIQAAGHLPYIDITAQKGYSKPAPFSGGGVAFLQEKTFVDTSNVTLSATLPLFEGGAVMSRTRQAQATYCAALQNLDFQRRTVDSQTRQSYRGILTGISQITALAQAIISNQSALDAVRAGYQAGTRTITEVLDAESTLLGVQRAYAKSRYEYLLEGLRLKRAAGILKCEDLEAVNGFLDSPQSPRSIPPSF